MLRRSILLVLTYLSGLVALAIWSIHGFLTGVPKEEWALMIVLPLAWAFSYWPMLGTLVLIARIRGLQRTLGKMPTELDSDREPGPENLGELEDIATSFAAYENRLPEFIVRPFIRNALQQATRDGTLKRIMEKDGDRARA
jgi:hypothetical protein